jgi:hypothetical protein
MAFKLKKTSDNLFHKVSESKLDGGKVTQQPQVNMEAPSSPAKSILPIGTGVAAAYTLGKAVVKKGKEIYSDYQSGKSAREKEQSAKPKVETKPNVKPNAGETKPKPKADPYSKAAKKDSKLGDYVAKRKTLKKGSAEWNANQNKINKAYGVKKRYDESKKVTTTNTGGGDDDKKVTTTTTTKVTKTPTVEKKETSTKASNLRKEGNKVLSDNSLSTEEKQKKALSIRRKYDKQNSKVEKKAKVKTAKVGKIKARANVAEAKGNNRRAERLKAKAERKETGISRKDQGRNIFGGKTRKQKKKDAQVKKAGSAPDFSGMS